MRRFTKRSAVWAGLFVVAVSVLVVLLVLIGVGYLRLPSAAGPSVTVSEVKWTVIQGQTSHGQGWFGPGEFNYTPSNGWESPSFAAGSKFDVTWDIINYDQTDHTIFTVTVGAPYEFAGVARGLPLAIGQGDEGNVLAVYVTTPSSTSGSFPLLITVNALSPG